MKVGKREKIGRSWIINNKRRFEGNDLGKLGRRIEGKIELDKWKKVERRKIEIIEKEKRDDEIECKEIEMCIGERIGKVDISLIKKLNKEIGIIIEERIEDIIIIDGEWRKIEIKRKRILMKNERGDKVKLEGKDKEKRENMKGNYRRRVEKKVNKGGKESEFEKGMKKKIIKCGLRRKIEIEIEKGRVWRELKWKVLRNGREV